MENNDKKVTHYFTTEVVKFSQALLPIAVEGLNGNRKWVNWGVDNMYPRYLIDLLAKSSLHSSITKQKAMLIGGCGFSKTNLSPEAKTMLANVFDDEDLDTILSKISLDLEVYSGFYLNLIWSKDGKRISQIRYIDPSKIRIENDKNKQSDTENYFFCNDWLRNREEAYAPILYKGFSDNDRSEKSQILYVKEYRPGTEFYAVPEYVSGIRWMEIEFSISNWHYNNIEKGFAPSMSINFPIGEPSKEEMAKITRRLKEQFEGSNNAGNVVITFSETPDTAVTFNTIELNTTDARFLMLNDQATEGVLKAHRVVDPEMFGIKMPGQLGINTNIAQSYELFQKQYVDPKQRLIEKVFNKIARINGIQDNFLINRYVPQFSKIHTTDVLSILTAALTPEQKYYMLVANDYDMNTAKKLSGYDSNTPQNNNPTNE